MSAPQVIVYPRGQLTTVDHDTLKAAGFVVVEADDPKAVVTHLPSVPLVTANAMLMCALEAMAGPTAGSERARFTQLLLEAMKKAEAAA